MKRIRVVGIVLAAAVFSVRAPAVGGTSAFEQAGHAITELELERARKLLASAGGDTPALVFERARLALHGGDCDAALALMSSPSLAGGDEANGLAEVARGCAQAMAGAEVVEDPARGIWIRLQDREDRVLVPFLAAVVSHTRRELANDLGIELPRPIRIELVRDLFSLAAVSGLPLAAAETTGTVGVARLGRVILVSPRATTFGYPWQDTLAHELTHLALTRVTRDKAPLWLQEGIAKLHETAWRDPRPFDGTSGYSRSAINALVNGQAIALDQLGPSIALLPTPEKAMAAYAQVTSFVDYWITKNGTPALRLLFMDLRGTGDKGAEPALRSVTGHDLGVWQAKWRMNLLSGPGAGRDGAPEPTPAPPANAVEVARAMRLGDLLFQRGHYAAASLKLQAASDQAPRGAAVRWRAARALVESHQLPEARARLGELADIDGPHGAWYALKGRFCVEARDPAQAERWDGLGLAYDPLSVDVACKGHWEKPRRDDPSHDGPPADPVLPSDPARRALCMGALRVPRD